MLKKFAVLLMLALILVMPQLVHAESMYDEHGFARNGKVEAYDRDMQGADKSGRNKRGFYASPITRDELEMGHTWDEQYESDEATESLYFYKDGTPKPGTFWTPEEEKRHNEEVKRINDEMNAEHMASLAKQEKERAERKKQAELGSKVRTWLYSIAFGIYLATMVYVKITDSKNFGIRCFVISSNFALAVIFLALIITFFTDCDFSTILGCILLLPFGNMLCVWAEEDAKSIKNEEKWEKKQVAKKKETEIKRSPEWRRPLGKQRQKQAEKIKLYKENGEKLKQQMIMSAHNRKLNDLYENGDRYVIYDPDDVFVYDRPRLFVKVQFKDDLDMYVYKFDFHNVRSGDIVWVKSKSGEKVAGYVIDWFLCRPSEMNLPDSWYQEVLGSGGQKSVAYAREKTQEEIKKIMSEIRPPTEEEKSLYSRFRF